MLPKLTSPWTVGAFASLCILVGFIVWRDAPEGIKLAGALVGIFATLVASANRGGSGAAALVLVVATFGACTTTGKVIAAEDAAKVAICVAENQGQPLEIVVAKCAVENVSPDDIKRMLEATKRAGCAASSPAKDGGK